KIIVTITDGAPTLSYISGTGNTNNNIRGDGTSFTFTGSNHGVPTIATAQSLMHNYELYTLGICLAGVDASAGASIQDIQQVINVISSSPNNAYMADTVSEMVDALNEIANKLNKSVVNGSIEDPMGEYFQLQTDYPPVLT